MIDANQVAEMFGTMTAAMPTGTVKPIPTVIPTPPEFQRIGETGMRTLWVVFVVMVLSSGGFTLLSWNVPTNRRLYHVITTLITIIAALSYFAMASGDGNRFHCDWTKDEHDKVPDTHHVICRSVYWARYVDWALTTPLLLLDLCLLAGIDGAHTLMAVVADLIMVVTGLFAAFGHEGTAQKWGWYTIACVAYIFVIWHVGVTGSHMVKAKGNRVIKLFSSLGLFTLILWTAYPIVWGFTEGARMTSVDTEIIIYAILDILAKPVFGFWLLLTHRSIPETNVEVEGYWSHGLSADGRIRIGDDDEGA